MNDDNNEIKKEELEINRKNREDYEKLMKDSSTNLDRYWDKNNAFVKLLLLILGIIIVIGFIYFILQYLSIK